MEGAVLVVRMPCGMPDRVEQEWVQRMKEKVERRRRRRALNADPDLVRRAEDLNRRYFGARLDYSIQWVTNQRSRWGSCTPSDGSIRISHELAGMPRFVLDYVIVHELAHLLRPDHSPAFWELVHRYPQTERAIGYLMGYCAAAGVEEPCGVPSRRPVPVATP